MLALLDKEKKKYPIKQKMADVTMGFGTAAFGHSCYDHHKAQTLLWSFWCSSLLHAAACSKENAVPRCSVSPCCAVLCCAVLCCAVLCCAVLCCAVLCCVCCRAVAEVSTCVQDWGQRCHEQRASKLKAERCRCLPSKDSTN